MISHYPVFFSLKSYCYLTQTCGNKMPTGIIDFTQFSELLASCVRIYRGRFGVVPCIILLKRLSLSHAFLGLRLTGTVLLIQDLMTKTMHSFKQSSNLRRTFLWYYFSDTVHNLISLFLLQHFSHARYWRQKKIQMRCSQRHISISIHKTNKSSSTSSQTSGSIITVKILTSLMSSIR